MLRKLERFAWVGCLALGIQTSCGFALLGPNNEPWQIPELAYSPVGDALPAGPKQINQEYRRNTPVMYYTFDSTFLEFFGSDGVDAVDQAFQVYNDLGRVSSYSRELTEFPYATTRENYLAGALALTDLRSYVMQAIAEQVGLADSIRNVWELHDRWKGPAPVPCPDDMWYIVIKRNYDLLPSPLNQYVYSSYVNGVLYSYYIVEGCDPPNPLAIAWEFPVDPLDVSSIPVSSWLGVGMLQVSPSPSYEGLFLTGLTRDDVAGLRYLYQTNNVNWEPTAPFALGLFTNAAPTLLYSSNLSQFAEQALTNSPAALAALYPDLIILSSSNSFRTAWVTNLVTYFTNSPYDPATLGPRLATRLETTFVVEQLWDHTFGNLRQVIFTNGVWAAVPVTSLSSLQGHGFVTYQEETVGLSSSPYAPAGSVTTTTNISSRTFATNQVVGEFIILPTNVCDVALLSTALTLANRYTNIVTSITSDVVVSNATGGTNFTVSYTLSAITYSTNHAFVALPVLCVQTNLVLAQGIEEINFVRRDYDSLLGRFFTPVTNEYTLNIVTNNRLQALRMIQPVTQPDFLFTAADLSPGPSADPTDSALVARNITFNTNGLAFYPGNFGPGTIESPIPATYVLNNVGENYMVLSREAYFRGDAEASQIPLVLWGSFDGTTNPPVVYPNGTSLQNLEQLIFWQVGPDFLEDAIVGLPYDAAFTAPGATGPLSWTLIGGSLPPGLTLNNNGTLSGRASFAASYGFTVRVTDSTGRSADRKFTLKVKRF